MKKLAFLAAFLIAMVWQANAQEMANKDGDYAKRPELDKFVGTWVWQSGDSIFTVVLAKTVINIKKSAKQNDEEHYKIFKEPGNTERLYPDATMDYIIGWHELKVNGKVIQSSLKNKSKPYDYTRRDTQTIKANVMPGKCSKDFLDFSYFTDLLIEGNHYGGNFTLLGDGNSAELYISYPPEYMKRATPDDPAVFARNLPTRIVLKRVK
jgi:hypothetical protein